MNQIVQVLFQGNPELQIVDSKVNNGTEKYVLFHNGILYVF